MAKYSQVATESGEFPYHSGSVLQTHKAALVLMYMQVTALRTAQLTSDSQDTIQGQKLRTRNKGCQNSEDINKAKYLLAQLLTSQKSAAADSSAAPSICI